VSYVMNGGPRSVSDATRERVLKAVAELGYRPNAVARALRSASSRVIGLIVPDITNPFFAELALAIERGAFARGYSLFLGNAMHEDEQQAGYLRAFSDHQVRGVLVIGATAGPRGMFPPATKAALATQSMTLVFLDRVPRGTNGVMLRVDNTRGAYEGTRHLAVDHAHRQIGCISGPESASSARDRDRGWAKALTEAGIDPKKQLRGRAEFDRYHAFEVARTMFSARKRPTALFVHSDEQAIGVLYAAAAEDLRIPEDLAVVSFDGIRESALTQPPLTTVEQPLELAAERALDLLIEGIDSGQNAAKTETLPVRLIVRESCGCAARERKKSGRTGRKVALTA
jgi:LacI family transcriptional regulator